jgi:WD40 repeat protein
VVSTLATYRVKTRFSKCAASKWVNVRRYGLENENILVSASGDGSVKVWDVAGPPQMNPLRSFEAGTRGGTLQSTLHRNLTSHFIHMARRLFFISRHVALQVAFERQTLKPVFHLIGFRLWV